jgi:hypothetical protein
VKEKTSRKRCPPLRRGETQPVLLLAVRPPVHQVALEEFNFDKFVEFHFVRLLVGSLVHLLVGSLVGWSFVGWFVGSTTEQMHPTTK